MRWLLLKDLQIMRRSPLVTGLLIVYPIVIAVLIGFALSRSPEKPRVGFLNQVPEAQQIGIGDGDFDKGIAKEQLCERVECIEVSSRAEAEDLVADGEVLAALILPADLIDKLQSLAALNPEQPVVEVLVNEDDPIKAQLVEDRINALITEANLLVAQQISQQGATYLDLLLKGGDFNLFGQEIEILGLENAGEALEEVRGKVDDAEAARELERVIEFAGLARDNLGLAIPLLGAIAEPIDVDTQVVEGDAPSLDSFAIAISATVTLMFVTVLLVAGSLALEREENVFARLSRGLVGRWALLAEKLILGIVVSLGVTVLMLAGLELFVSLQWERFPLWLLAIVAGGAGFAAFGAAIGAGAGDVRASSLLAFMISLPIAFLSLIPSGAVSPALFDIVETVRALFPFDPALDAISGALEESGPSVAAAAGHLAVIVAGWSLLARLALRRLA